MEYPSDFLYLVDYNLFAIADQTENDDLRKLINNIRDRKLLKRAFSINRGSIKKTSVPPVDISDLRDILSKRSELGDATTLDKLSAEIDRNCQASVEEASMTGIIKLLDQKCGDSDRNSYLRTLAKRIWEKSEVKCLLQEVWIDIPKAPLSQESQSVMVRSRNSSVATINSCKNIDNYYPFAQYRDLYENNRLNGYVFAPEDCLDKVAQAAKEILEDELNVEFNETAFTHGK